MDNRREFFLKILGVLISGAALLKGKAANAKKLGVLLDKLPSLSKVDGFAAVKLNDLDILLIRETEKSVKAVSSKCTHRNCDLSYNSTSKKIECKCHGAAFSTDGKVLQGPAKSDLKNYQAVLENEKIILTVE